MKIENQSFNELAVTFDNDEDIVAGAKHAVSQGENNPNVWNVYLSLTTAQWSPIRMKLQDMGFLPAGFVSIDTKTSVKLKKSIRKSGDGGCQANDVDLAVNPPVLPPTATERAAIDELLSRPEYAALRDRF